MKSFYPVQFFAEDEHSGFDQGFNIAHYEASSAVLVIETVER